MNSDCCCKTHSVDPAACGCCEGVKALTPMPIANRPGLPTISRRIGTHGTFLETMRARLSSSAHPALAGLTTREPDDPALALLDAWAAVGDVLAFYQERIANEAYLRTATERRSVLEMARLIGYRPRPGVSAGVHLAFTVDPGHTEETLIPAGSRCQSVPGPGETAQSFETSEDLRARAQWNNLRPRLSRPQTKESILQGDGTRSHVYLEGIATNLKANDALLIDFDDGDPEFHLVREVVADSDANRTRVILQAAAPARDPVKAKAPTDLIAALTVPPSVPPAHASRLARSLKDQFGGAGKNQGGSELLRKLNTGEAGYAVSKVFAPALQRTLTAAAANAQVTPRNRITVFALRAKAKPFGANAPKRMRLNDAREMIVIGDWPILEGQPNGERRVEHEKEFEIHLDGSLDKILPDSWLVVETPETRLSRRDRLIVKARRPDPGASRAEYGLSGPATRIEIDKPWLFELANLPPSAAADNDFDVLRKTIVHAGAEPLALAEEPITQPVCGGADDLIELDGFYEGLQAGRWVIVSGEREIEGTQSVRFSELSMLSSVSQGVRPGLDGETPLPGDRTHSFIRLAQPLVYCFKRDTVTVYGNVAHATHGETRLETLGSGDGARALQKFELKQPPLTFTAASNPDGSASSLKIYVNDLRWHESPSLYGLESSDRSFVTQTDDEGRTSVVFGNGRQGARLPTGVENVRADYRNGLGKSGNVRTGQISLLSTRPLGVKEVINPLPAAGGADPETRDQARRNAPLAVAALDRLVSVRDYQDFARVFAGVGKARSLELSDGRRRIVHLTIAGVDDAPAPPHSDLRRNLSQALRRFGDPDQAFRIDVRELKLLVLSARVQIHPDHLWEKLEPAIRAALLEAFSFERRDLGQDALLSEAVLTVQSIAGVEYVDVDTFGGVSEKNDAGRLRSPFEIAEAVEQIADDSLTDGPQPRVRANLARYGPDGAPRPAELVFLTPAVPDCLILNEVPR